MSRNAELVARDLAVLWHPCSQMKDFEQYPLIPIKSGQGVWLEDFEGNRFIDAISSWWVNIFGHANPRINAAIIDQLGKLEHVILAGFSHLPVIELSERLVQITPPGLSHCFYADNGSSGVEVALKMSYHFWRNHGKPNKHKFICLENAYHGETLGALSVGDVALYKSTYQPLLMQCLKAPSPEALLAQPGESAEAFARRRFVDMAALIDEHADELSAVIVEPLLQCAAGMRMYHPIYLELLSAHCKARDVHLIADEIAAGFGRTGTLFACDQANITPDFMCLSKGLTAGYLPLSVVLTNNDVYQAFYDDYEKMTAFLHSHSYTGNPLACRTALATLDIFESDNVIENNHHLSRQMGAAMEEMKSHPHVGDVRQYGMVLAVEMMRGQKKPYPWQERRGMRVYEYGLSRGVLLRPLGNVVYFMPPYVITEDEIKILTDVAKDAIHHATKEG